MINGHINPIPNANYHASKAPTPKRNNGGGGEKNREGTRRKKKPGRETGTIRKYFVLPKQLKKASKQIEPENDIILR